MVKRTRKPRGRPSDGLVRQRTTVYLPEQIHDKLLDYGYENGISLSALLSRLALDFLREKWNDIPIRPTDSNLKRELDFLTGKTSTKRKRCS